jgi:CRP-like cAMP-binding protein
MQVRGLGKHPRTGKELVLPIKVPSTYADQALLQPTKRRVILMAVSDSTVLEISRHEFDAMFGDLKGLHDKVCRCDVC